MKHLRFLIFALIGTAILLASCDEDENTSDDDELTADEEGAIGVATLVAAFEEFNTDAVTVSFDGDEITIEPTGLPNHTSPYWDDTSDLYIAQLVGDHLTPGTIRSGSYTFTVSTTRLRN